MTTKKSEAKSKDGLATAVLSELKSGKAVRESFYLSLENGQLTIGWISENPGEDKVHRSRILNIGESVSDANVEQSIRSQIGD